MSWKLSDRWLWLGFGAFLFISAKGISHALRKTIILSDIYDPEHAKASNETQAEDSISLESLSHLSTSPNHDIANAATSLLLARFAQSDSVSTSLTLDLFSSDVETRQKAKYVLELFDNVSADLQPLREDAVNRLYDKSGPAVQMMCRGFFRGMRRYRQGRIGSLRTVAEMVEDSTMLTRRNSRLPNQVVFPQEDTPLAIRFHPASQRVESLVELLAEQAAGLQTTHPTVRFQSPTASMSSSTSSLPILEEVHASGDTGLATGRRARFQDESAEEVELRRRRREAMVLHEGGGVIGRENIIHPRRRNS